MIRKLARPMLASVFVWEGVDNLRNASEHVKETEGLTQQDDPQKGELKQAEKLNKELSKIRSEEVKAAEPKGVASWSDYSSELK